MISQCNSVDSFYIFSNLNDKMKFLLFSLRRAQSAYFRLIEPPVNVRIMRWNLPSPMVLTNSDRSREILAYSVDK